MRKLIIVTISFFSQLASGQAIQTKFEQSNGMESPSYHEIVQWWSNLDLHSNKVKMLTMGITDAGFPLNLVVISNDGKSDLKKVDRKNKRVILINNGIHPGEPDGIDACMLLARDIVEGKFKLPENIVLAIIPVYNIGGCLNRNADYRIDQNGPIEKGFRGNSQNLDLNRDFIKSDSKEARSFAAIFHFADPDVFVDNHVSDGADYQHIMTLLTSQHDKLGGQMGAYLKNQFEPALYTLMKQKSYDLVPYVNSFDDTPESGWPEYWDSPRYSTGYATLWSTFAFMPETHMLKPYQQRVHSTLALMQSFIEFTSTHSDEIRDLRAHTRDSLLKADKFPLAWKIDRSQWKAVDFKGFEAVHKPSNISGLPRLYYDRTKPFEKMVRVFDHYTATTWVDKPLAYVIPQGWWKIIELLKINEVHMSQLRADTVIEVQVSHIDDFKSTAHQYEMHHVNSGVTLSTSLQKVKFRKGDWYIPLNQLANRFLVETLDPQGEDSYFAWNFFDAILGQKEGFSDYSFEDIAARYVAKDTALKIELDEKRKTDTAFAKSGAAQLNFVYEHSPYFETDYLRYPVYSIVKK